LNSAVRESVTPVRGLEPALEARAKQPSTRVPDLTKTLLETAKKFKGEKEQVWKDKFLLHELTFHFVEGRHLLRRGKNGQWRLAPMPERTDSPVHSYNLVGFYSANIKAKWVQSNTDVKFRAARDADDAVGAADAATTVHEHYRRRLYDEHFRQREATFAQCGRYARYFYFSEDAKGYARKPRVEEQLVSFGESAYFCPDCGSTGTLGDQGGLPAGPAAAPADDIAGSVAPGDLRAGNPGGLPAVGDDDAGVYGVQGVGLVPCPACGSPNAEVMEAPPVPVESVTGYDEFEVPDLVCETVPTFELKHEIDRLPQESDWLLRSRRVRASVLQGLYDFLKVGSARNEDYGLDRQQQLAEATYLSAAKSFASKYGGEKDDYVDFDQWWLQPCLYKDWVLENPVQTLEGQEIPAGTPLVEVFPDGLYFCTIAGIEGVVEVANESHREHFVGGVYEMAASNALGKGIEDMVDANRQFNLIYSMIYEQLRSATWPATLYEESLFPNGLAAYIGRGNKNLPVKTMGLPENRTLPQSVHQLQPVPPAAASFQFPKELEFVIQKASRVMDFSGGLPGVDNDTATGAEIAAANSQGLFAPMLELKGEVDRQSAVVIVKLNQRYGFERYFTIAGKRGRQDGAWLNAADLDVDIYADVVRGSAIPRTEFERRQNLERFLLAVGGVPGALALMQQSPATFEMLTEAYDVDFGGEDYSAAAKLARQRVDQMKAALPMLQAHLQMMPPTEMAVDPVTGEAAEVPVDLDAVAGELLVQSIQYTVEPEELGLLAGVDFLRDLLTCDEILDGPRELKQGVKALIMLYLQYAMQQQAFMSMFQTAGQPAQPEDGGGPEQGKKGKGGSRDASQHRGGGANTPAQKQKERQPQPAAA
jgi:hypothetical protein